MTVIFPISVSWWYFQHLRISLTFSSFSLQFKDADSSRSVETVFIQPRLSPLLTALRLDNLLQHLTPQSIQGSRLISVGAKQNLTAM